MISPSKQATAGRLPGLDFLRALAILWVMLLHASLSHLVSHDSWIVSFGWMGVDLFFVLSGFLIAGQLFRPWVRGEKFSYKIFLSRRLLRTLPAYLTMVIVYFSFPGLRETQDIQPLWQFLSFTENLYVDVTTSKAFSHVLSLCVEEQFYIVFPVLAALLAIKPSIRKTATVFLAIVLFGMGLRGWRWMHYIAPAPYQTSPNFLACLSG